MFLFTLVFLLTIFIDQVTKYLVERNLYEKSIDIIENIFSFTYLRNRGAAWGIFSENNLILMILIPILITVIGVYLYKTGNTKFELIVGGVILGGAIGNYIDRIFRGYVVDFLDFKIWPIFNLADVFIVVGCILLIINLFRKDVSNES